MTANAKPTYERKDLYQEVTNRIIDLMETGKLTFSNNINFKIPRNASTGKAYRGINILMLWASCMDSGFISRDWLTFKQAQALGGNVRKGSKGTRIFYFERITVDKNTDEEREIPMLKSYTVFNTEQCENLPENIRAVLDEEEKPFVAHAEIEAVLARFNVSTVHGDYCPPCYIPKFDQINMPHKGLFADECSYYATLLHENVHATGAKLRLNRDFGGRFGTESYAFEELIAELGASFLCAEFGLIEASIYNHAAYLQSWLKILKSDKKAIFTAAAAASRAAELILGVAEDVEQQRAA